MLRIIILFLMLTSCTTTQDPVCLSGDSFCLINFPKHDVFFDRYIEKIQKDINKYDKNINIKNRIPFLFSSKLPNKIVAQCVRYFGERHSILINNEVKNDFERNESYMPYFIDIVLRHEIAHCFFDKKHNYELILLDKNIKKYINVSNGYTGIEKTFIPKSIMYPTSVTVHTYLDNKDYYDSEIFNCKPNMGESTIIESKNGLKNDEEYFNIYDMVEYEVYNKEKKLILKTNDYREFYNIYNKKL